MNDDHSVDHEAIDEMFCQLCLTRKATCHVTQQVPGGRFEDTYYCSECYEAKYLKPPPSDHGLPRPRFTIKGVMVLVAVLSIPNAIAAWVMRSGYIVGTLAQLRQWTIDAFLAVNLVSGFFVVWFWLMTWVDQVKWYNRSGGIVTSPPDPKRKS